MPGSPLVRLVSRASPSAPQHGPPVGRRDPDPPDYREFYTNESSDRKVRSLLADAQVHATLALAAAALEPPRTGHTPRPAAVKPDVPFTPKPTRVEFGTGKDRR